MNDTEPPFPRPVHLRPTLRRRWFVVDVIKALLLVIGAFAFACSTVSMFFRASDDHVVVGAIFFGTFSVCVVGLAIVAALHRVFIAVDELIVSREMSQVGGASSVRT